VNYRHAFHAGNFADLVKHGALLQLLARMTAEPGPLTVIDTHAGRGLYDLGGSESQRSGEAEAGIQKLMGAPDLPKVFAPLRAAVIKANPQGGVTRFYPGSPWLIAQALRPGDTYLACELRPEEHSALSQVMAGRPGVTTACVDGYRAAVERLPAKGAALVLIDPPFERDDDYRQITATLRAVEKKNPQAVVLVWLPLKDLETFDAFLRETDGPLLVAEARMRPLTDPMKMNGCALVLAQAPAEIAQPLEALCAWTAQTLGQGGQARVWMTS
jgi:23S rRNA (adenine2030-N6)-methyltransferase